MNKDESTLINSQNQLLSAAEPLLSDSEQYNEQNYRRICESVTHFENKAKDIGYDKATIEDACFFLCAFIDEMFDWKKPLLETFFESNAEKNTEFFDRLSTRQKNPTANIDLLELAYICLSLGFRGKYQNAAPGNGVIDEMDKLYSAIRDIRGDSTTTLSQAKEQKEERYWRCPPIWVTAIIALIILFSIFFPYSNRLKQYATPALQTLNNITKTDVGSDEN